MPHKAEALWLSGKRQRRRVFGVEWNGVWEWVSLPQPTRGFGKASWAPPAGYGAEPGGKCTLAYFEGHRMLLSAHITKIEKGIREKSTDLFLLHFIYSLYTELKARQSLFLEV